MVNETEKPSGIKHFLTHWPWWKIILWLCFMGVIRFIVLFIAEILENGW